MLGKSVYKVPNGKLLKVTLDFWGDRINSVRLTGDFFIYPEDAIVKIEEGLAGKEIDKQVLAAEIKNVASRLNAEFFGIDPESIAHAILLAKEAGA